MYFKEPLKTNLVGNMRSGMFSKVTGRLTDGHGGFCVLGLACYTVEPTGFDAFNFFHYGDEQAGFTLLGGFARDWTTGLHDWTYSDETLFSLNEEQQEAARNMFPDVFGSHDGDITLSKISDAGDVTFEQLADFIEQHC